MSDVPPRIAVRARPGSVTIIDGVQLEPGDYIQVDGKLVRLDDKPAEG